MAVFGRKIRRPFPAVAPGVLAGSVAWTALARPRCQVLVSVPNKSPFR